ncbi:MULTISPECIES: hypothetical protein [unclassified Aureimonas]|uniref:DUF7736 domain-containing protein n=1 Tax=unclassified Aureimonas TaxID=2615206 RepID=UPI0006F37569|nr:MULTISPECIES: hypothetical protein [unclassified Aureimonas]KQT52183.1 hypothetical protein ASG62_16120 [Aureimonas sp. Leaf427]KQT70584.1 hypothetical protein ASG54_21830 [Aureimonas sp. Leaf460]
MAETHEFPTLEVATAMTGIALCSTSISRMHEIATVLAGHDVWTHELGHRETMDAIGAHARIGLPDMPTRHEAEANWKAAAEKATSAYGDTVTVTRGTMQRSADPVSTLAGMMNKPAA